MKKQLLTLNFVIIFAAVMFSMFVCGLGESNAFAASPTAVQSATVKTLNKPVKKDLVVPKTIPEKNSYALTHMGKNGIQYKFFKFVMAMLGVLVSSLAIYGGLKLYKKFLLKNNLKSDTIDYSKNLESPKDFKEAVNLFLDKTDK